MSIYNDLPDNLVVAFLNTYTEPGVHDPEEYRENIDQLKKQVMKRKIPQNSFATWVDFS